MDGGEVIDANPRNEQNGDNKPITSNFLEHTKIILPADTSVKADHPALIILKYPLI